MVQFGEIGFDYILERLITWQLEGNYINTKHREQICCTAEMAHKITFPVSSFILGRSRSLKCSLMSRILSIFLSHIHTHTFKCLDLSSCFVLLSH